MQECQEFKFESFDLKTVFLETWRHLVDLRCLFRDDKVHVAFSQLSGLKNPRNQNIPFTEHPGCGRLSCFNLLWLLSRKIPYVDHLLTYYVNRFIFNITAKNSLYLVPLLQDLMYSVVVICTFLRLQRPRTSLHP